MIRVRLKSSLVILSVALISGCASLSYYSQALEGQMELLEKRQPIKRVIADKSVDKKLSARLQMLVEARAFAIQHLKLPQNDSYTTYADLKRRYVMWSVFATPAYALIPVRWCYPIVGCISYRNYFSRHEAELFADKLRAQGLDVYISGVPAYSTLGWFDDPVTNTMMHWEDHDLVGTLFHEMAHQQLYIKNDTVFNESFARTVEQEGLRLWMAGRNNKKEFEQYLLDRKREKQFVEMVLVYRRKLEALFASDVADSEKRVVKLEIFRQLRAAYYQLRKSWGGYPGYDGWMLTGVNNAKIQSVATYYDYVPALVGMLNADKGDFSAFYRRAEQLRSLSFAERQHLLSRQSAVK